MPLSLSSLNQRHGIYPADSYSTVESPESFSPCDRAALNIVGQAFEHFFSVFRIRIRHGLLDPEPYSEYVTRSRHLKTAVTNF